MLSLKKIKQQSRRQEAARCSRAPVGQQPAPAPRSGSILRRSGQQRCNNHNVVFGLTYTALAFDETHTFLQEVHCIPILPGSKLEPVVEEVVEEVVEVPRAPPEEEIDLQFDDDAGDEPAEPNVDMQFDDDAGDEPAEPIVSRKRVSLKRELAALCCDLGVFWSTTTPPRRLRRSRRSSKAPERFSPSF